MVAFSSETPVFSLGSNDRCKARPVRYCDDDSIWKTPSYQIARLNLINDSSFNSPTVKAQQKAWCTLSCSVVASSVVLRMKD